MHAVADGLLWVPETRLVSLVGIPRSTYQSWEQEGLLTRSATGAYAESDVIETIVIAAIRAQLPLAATGNAMRQMRASGAVADLVDRARALQADELFDLVIDPHRATVVVCDDTRSLVAAVHDQHVARTVTVVPLARTLSDAIVAFRNHAQRGRPPTTRARGRPRATRSDQATITELRRS